MALLKHKTKDGSMTYFNEEIGDFYKAINGALSESVLKHAKGLEISRRDKKEIVILDICFGAGYNCLAAISEVKKKDKLKYTNTKLIIYCFENDKRILEKVQDIEFCDIDKELDVDVSYYEIIQKFVNDFLECKKTEYEEDNIKLIMMYGDAKTEIDKVNNNIADFCFFDPFSPEKVKDMWSVEFFKKVFAKMNHGGRLTTYSHARFVRDNFAAAGFTVTDGLYFRRRCPSTIAEKK
jgi:tRNA U34 5-methylaminomethyl-2-thiouridine-forming methyltransferase MnmC